MRVLTFSQSFPKGHIRQGDATFFMEKILCGLGITMKTLPVHLTNVVNDFQMLLEPDDTKLTTIRSGNRWKAGDMASLRVWSGTPYNSKQIGFAQVEVKNTWEFKIYRVWDDLYVDVGKDIGLPFYRTTKVIGIVARNDGLSIEDFISWFSIHPKKTGAEFSGQIISWHDNLNY